MQDNAAQQLWYSILGIIPLPILVFGIVFAAKYCTGGTILVANTIPNTGKFAKMVHSDFFCEDGGTLEVLITLT